MPFQFTRTRQSLVSHIVVPAPIKLSKPWRTPKQKPQGKE